MSEALGIDLKREAFKMGATYVNKAIYSNSNWKTLRGYFQIDNFYVLQKIFLMLYPYRDQSWSRQQKQPSLSIGYIEEEEVKLEPLTMDVSQPDLYIPLMSAITYVLLLAAEMGMKGQFLPEKLGGITTKALMLEVLEVAIIKAVGFFLDNNSLEILDIIAFSGYKYSVKILMKVLSLFLPDILRNIFNLYISVSFLVFLARTLKNVLLVGTPVSNVRQKTIYFLFLVVLIDGIMMMFLS